MLITTKWGKRIANVPRSQLVDTLSAMPSGVYQIGEQTAIVRGGKVEISPALDNPPAFDNRANCIDCINCRFPCNCAK